MREIFLKILTIMIVIAKSNSNIELREDALDSDIEDIILILAPGLVLNLETPADTFIGDISVITFSKNNYRALMIDEDNEFVYLVDEKLYLKDSGNIILQNVNHITFEVTAIDANEPPGLFSKYLRIPVDHKKEDSVFKVESIDDLCNTDSNRFLFSLDIDDPNYDPLKPYDCRLTRTNYPNVDFLEYKMNNTHYEIFLPAFDSPMQTSFFDLEKSPVLLIEISCTNNMVTTHQRTVDFKICKKILPIENLILDGGISDSDVWIQFDSQPGTSVAQLKVVDYSNRYLDNYEFYLAEANEYLDVSRNGMIRIRRKLETSLLKYYFPKLKITAAVADLMEAGRDIQRMFRFNINDTNQPLPPLRFRPDFQLIPIFQFAQQAEFLIKLGQFELNSTTYPPDRFDIRLAAGNVTLDDQGNLYIGQDPLNDINAENKTAIVALNIYDKKANVSVFEDIFEIDIPELPTTAVSAPTTNFPITTPIKIPDILECVSDRDCNSQRVGPNKCIRLSSLREQTMNRSNDVETTLRVMQFLINKDASIFLKYNEILLVLQSQDKELQDVLDKYQITQKDLADVGACLCDQDTQGWRCETPLPNPTPYKCHPNSTVPACIPQNGVCRPSEFLLRNTIKIPSERLLEYRSYYCECTATGIVGVNCDYRRNPCNVPRQQQRRFRRQYDGELEPIVAKQSAPFISDSVSQYPTSGLGSLDANQGQCNADPTKEFCQPQVSISQLSSYKCVKQPQAEVANYLVFDESNRNPYFANNVDTYKKLNLSDATVAVGIQSFIRDEVMPRYSFNDYSKIPKGPLAIMRPSVNMPNILNSVRNKVNGLIDRRAEEVLDQLQYARVQDLVQDTLLYLIATNKINISLTGDNLTQTILQTVNKLNVNNLKNFSTPLWSLIPDQFPANLTNPNDPTGLIRHLNALQSNSDRLNSPDLLGNVLGLNADNQRYIDFFNFSTRPYSLLKLDILPGIFIDSDNELSLRPVPGVFLESIPTDPASPDRELIFLPGIFNPVATANCDLRSLFMPGIMSLPIDNYDLANLPFDNSRYLNRFVPMQIPFNINGFITPMRASASDTIASLLMQQQNTTFNSHLLLTPIDFNAEATFDIIAKNDKFITNLFSDRSFNQVVEQQKPLDAQNLASTLVLSDPTMIGLNKQDSLNSACLNRTGFLPPYDARGTQFYNTSTPVTNVTVLPFVVYDDAGNPIPQAVVKAAIDKYCETYMAQMNDFHARICAAQAQTNKILEEQKKGLCPGCPFSQLAYEYYNPRNVKKRNSIPILVLASILAALWLLWMLSMLLCCCFRWCPLYSLFCGKNRPKKPQLVMTNKSAKVFNKGTNNNQVRPVDSIYTMIANGELVRSSPKDQARSFYTFSNAVPEPSRPLAYALSGPGKIITPSGGLLPAPPVISRNSLIPQFKHDKSELIINEPFAPSVHTNRSVLIKPSTNLSTVFSSSLVKPLSLPAASPGMFVAKRLLPPTNLKRSFSLINVTEFEQPVNFFKRSSSYPFIDIPNFYINNRFVDESWPRHVIYRFNKTTMIDENGKPSWKFFEVKDDWRPPSAAAAAVLKSPSSPLDFDDSISQITPNQRKNIEFKLKRLSNYIVDNPALESAPRVGSPTNPNFPLSRQDMERPPNYKSLSGPLIDQNDSNELVIDWLLRKTNNNDNDNESDVTSPSNLTVVRLENNRAPLSPPPQLSPPSALKRYASQRCFVCNQKVNDANANSDSNTNQDEAIYICDGCYESWYSAPAGTTTAKTPAASSSPRQRENESPTSTIYALTKDNRLQPNNRGKKNSSNF